MTAETTDKMYELAGEAYRQFEQKTRGDDVTYVTLKDDAPEWLHDLVREAHGEFLPDDWRYATIRAAIGYIHDNEPDDEDSHEFADGNVDVYSAARTAWLASNLKRAFYCDEAVSEGLVAGGADTLDRIGVGQYLESQEVYASVFDSLSERASEEAS